MKLNQLLWCGPLMALGGCATVGLPKAMGEASSSYGYVPLDPLPIDQAAGSDSCKAVARNATTDAGQKAASGILSKLPDQTIRFAVASFDASGSLTFGPSKLTTKGNQYRAVLDYIQADAVPVEFYVRKLVSAIDKDGNPISEARPMALGAVVFQGFKIVGYDVHETKAQLLSKDANHAALSAIEIEKRQEEIDSDTKSNLSEGYSIITIPVYVGVGLRLSADVLALEGGVTLAGLGAIGADAEAKRISGTLTVQSLGVSGKSIATALPLPSKLDQTTIENAILAVGNMRATLYASSEGADGVWIRPRVVGLYSPIGSNPALINAVYSELSRNRPRWLVPCGN